MIIPENMAEYVTIIYTKITNKYEIKTVAHVLGTINGISSWTMDTQDPDNVLRLESKEDIAQVVKTSLYQNDILSEVMAVFTKSTPYAYNSVL